MSERVTAEQLATAIDMAAHPEELRDQHGRIWSPWATYVPGHSRPCRKCGARIDHGYILAPDPTTAICARHFRRRQV